MSEKVEKILKQVKLLREAKGLTQGNMIATVNVKTAAAYNKIEKNLNISVQRLLEIAEALEVDISYFFQEEKNDSLLLNDHQAEIGYATKDDITELKMMLKSIKAEVTTIKTELQKPKTVKRKTK